MKRIASIIALVVMGGCYNLTGQTKAHAEAEAKQWAAEQVQAGADVTFTGSCNKHDSDNDGYVSCSFVVNGVPTTYECAGMQIIDSNHGCRVPKIKIPAPVVVNHGGGE